MGHMGLTNLLRYSSQKDELVQFYVLKEILDLKLGLESKDILTDYGCKYVPNVESEVGKVLTKYNS